MHRLGYFVGIAFLLVSPAVLHAQLVQEFNPAKTNCCFASTAQSLADQIHAGYVDYHSAIVDAKGYLKEGYSMDGLHPNDKGYELMAPLVQSAIAKIQNSF